MQRTFGQQSGFSVLQALIVVLVLGALAGTGWVVYQHNRTTVTDAAGNHQPATQQTDVTPTSPTPTVAYLTINEWGVKLPLSDTIKDAYYTVKGSGVGTDGQPNTAWLGLASLNATGCNVSTSGPSSSASPVGSIIRVLPTDKDPVAGILYTQLYPNGITLGGYYYAYAPWKNKTCASAATLQAVDSAFAGAARATAQAAAN